MKYIFEIQNLDCANCAIKTEAAVSKINEVVACSVNFFTLKMNIDTSIEMSDELLKRILKAAKKAQPKIKLRLI